MKYLWTIAIICNCEDDEMNLKSIKQLKYHFINKVYTNIIEKDENKSISTYFTASEQIDIKKLTKFLKEKNICI